MGDDPFSRFAEALQEEVDRRDEAIYSAKAIAEARAPFNNRPMSDPTAIGRFRGSCGDSMDIFLRVEGDVIVEATFITDGCGATLAVGGTLMRMSNGHTVDEAAAITEQDVLDAIDGLPEEKLHCAELGVTTLKIAIEHIPGR